MCKCACFWRRPKAFLCFSLSLLLPPSLQCTQCCVHFAWTDVAIPAQERNLVKICCPQISGKDAGWGYNAEKARQRAENYRWDGSSMFFNMGKMFATSSFAYFFARRFCNLFCVWHMRQLRMILRKLLSVLETTDAIPWTSTPLWVHLEHMFACSAMRVRRKLTWSWAHVCVHLQHACACSSVRV